MTLINYLRIWLITLLIRRGSAVSFNQPNFCPNASWNPIATTFADNNTVGTKPYDIFINTNNTIYVPNRVSGRVIIWSNESSIPTNNISVNTININSIFVSIEGDMYIDTYNWTYGISKWTLNPTNSVSILDTCGVCYDIFIDTSNTLYCSMDRLHQVITKSLNGVLDVVRIVAGIGMNGSASNMLAGPHGIFVDENFDLYVADYHNHRIQFFRSGESNGTTVVGSSSFNRTFTLNCPCAVVLDADKFLYIADFGSGSIIGSGPNGFRCLVGCSAFGSYSSSLSQPRSLSFDTHGNMFVVDGSNNRIQKFMLLANSCNDTTATTTNTTPVNIVRSLTTNVPLSTTMNGLKDNACNQPKLDQFAVWNPNAITFANDAAVGPFPFGIFINKNNTIFVPHRESGRIQIWMNDSALPTATLYDTYSYPNSIFVTMNGDIFVDSNSPMTHVNRWSLKTNTSTFSMNTIKQCFGLFVDINDILYCSMRDYSQVVTKPAYSTFNILTIVAGTGCNGTTSNMLWNPHGIFVDMNLDLYVADAGNNRIQLFRRGNLDGETAAGSGSPNMPLSLNHPTGIVLDGDQNLYIVDQANHRIVRSGPNGSRCLVGCSRSPNSTSNTLYFPTSMAFDSFGNIYVVDQSNKRIQKFRLLNQTLTPFYNQPKFDANTTWNPNAVTYANVNIIGSQPNGIFIDKNNSIYALHYRNGRIISWLSDSLTPTTTIYGNLTNPLTIFVTSDRNIYVDNGHVGHRVDKFTSNSNISVSVMSVEENCQGLFVDITCSLYCSIDNRHQVFKKWLGDNMTALTTVAGTGITGSTSNMLHNPNGIFVDTNFDLYVADSFNHRIQLFPLGRSDGITVAGSTSANITIALRNPVSVALDADGYLFIIDSLNNRIVGAGSNGFRCIVGCNGNGTAANQLSIPRHMSFDSFGNIYVTDRDNSRIQKFLLLHLDDSSTEETILTSSIGYVNVSSARTTINQNTSFPQETSVVNKLITSTTDLDDTDSSFSSTEPMTTSSSSSSLVFFPAGCQNQSTIGTYCNVSSAACNLLDPCQNDGTCIGKTEKIYGYECLCQRGFQGDECQYDRRPCKPNTCWHDGACTETSNSTFMCACQAGWTGDHCEIMINHCQDITCENNGVCRPLFMNYTCQCLGDSFSGRHCEIVAKKIYIRRFISKSLGYIAIIALVTVAAFVVMMDGLKYICGIDPVKDELERIRRAKRKKKVKRRPVIQRFTYVNARPSLKRRSLQRSSVVSKRKKSYMIAETTV